MLTFFYNLDHCICCLRKDAKYWGRSNPCYTNNELRVGGRITYKELITFSTFSEMVGKGIIIMKNYWITHLRNNLRCSEINVSIIVIILRNLQRIHLDLISMFAQKEANLHLCGIITDKYETNLREFNWVRLNDTIQSM